MALAGLLGLAGCGFAPVYQDAAALRGQFGFETEASVLGFALGNRLAERLGEAASPRFVIKASVTASERAAAITEAGDTARFNVIGFADWSVVEVATGQQVMTGRSDAFTSYATTGSTIATQTTQDDARKRLAIILADLIVTRVLVGAPDLAS